MARVDLSVVSDVKPRCTIGHLRLQQHQLADGVLHLVLNRFELLRIYCPLFVRLELFAMYL